MEEPLNSILEHLISNFFGFGNTHEVFTEGCMPVNETMTVDAILNTFVSPYSTV